MYNLDNDNNKYYTDTLEETIYYGKSNYTEEENKEQLNLFMKELIDRRRKDPIEGGLQASMVILPNSFAAKVNENDGMSTHSITHTNLIKFLNGEKKYLTDATKGLLSFSQKEMYQLLQEGVEVRILDGEEHILFALYSGNNKQTEFQFQVIRDLLDCCRNLKESGNYYFVEIGLSTPDIFTEIKDFNEEVCEDMLHSMEQKGNKR